MIYLIKRSLNTRKHCDFGASSRQRNINHLHRRADQHRSSAGVCFFVCLILIESFYRLYNKVATNYTYTDIGGTYMRCVCLRVLSVLVCARLVSVFETCASATNCINWITIYVRVQCVDRVAETQRERQSEWDNHRSSWTSSTSTTKTCNTPVRRQRNYSRSLSIYSYACVRSFVRCVAYTFAATTSRPSG